MKRFFLAVVLLLAVLGAAFWLFREATYYLPQPEPPIAIPKQQPKSDRSLNHLHPEMRNRLKTWLQSARAKGFQVIVYETYRTPQRQAWLHAQGRENDGRIVTQTLDSLHRYGLAADVVVLRFGKADFSHASYDKLYEAVPPENFGLERLGWDLPHLQISGGHRYARQHRITRDWLYLQWQK